MRNEEEDEGKYKIGSIVWAHLQGFPWWPSKVTKITKDKILVEFYENTKKPQCAWISPKSLKLFENDTIDNLISKHKVSKSLESAFKQGLQLAINDFEESKGEVVSDHESECYICGKSGYLLLCDGCSNSVHAQCEELDYIPEGDFYCLECQSRNPKKKISNSKPKPVNDVPPTKKVVQSARLREKQLREEEEEYYQFNEGGHKNRFDIQVYERSDPLPRILGREYWCLLSSYSNQQFKEFTVKFKYKYRKYIIKYRYENETNDDFRLLRCTSTEYMIFGWILKQLLKYDNVTDFSEIRFYDIEDEGWLLLKDDKQFSCKKDKIFIDLLVINKNE